MAVLRACSPIATALLALLLLPRPVAAVPHNHGHKHVHRHVSSANDLITLGPESLARRDAPTSVERMNDNQLAKAVQRCDSGPPQLPLFSDVPYPQLEHPSEQLHLFSVPESKPNTLTVHNYCSYDLTYQHEIPGIQPVKESLPAGGVVSVPLSGTVLKVDRTGDMTKPVNVEYSETQYNLSLIPCRGTIPDGTPMGKPTADVSSCAGHEAGLQLSQPGGLAFQCAPNAWCDDQAYFYGENLCKNDNPLGDLDKSKGLTMEFCASMKP